MTTEASLPSDDELEEPQTVEVLPEAPEWAEASLDEAPEAIEPPAEQIVAETADQLEPGDQPDEPAASIAQEDAEPAGDGMTEAMAAWTEALRSVERSISDAADAIRFLRATVQQMAPLWRSLGGLEDALHGFEEQPRRAPEPTPIESRLAASGYRDEEQVREPEPLQPLPSRFEEAPKLDRDWRGQRRKAAERERAPKWEEAESGWTPPASSRPSPKPVTLVPDDTPAPYAYKLTIEDRNNSVELLDLHRALTSIASVRNLSLLNYVNGIASLSVEATDEVQPSDLENAIKKIMKRSCSVVPHESNVILIQVGE